MPPCLALTLAAWAAPRQHTAPLRPLLPSFVLLGWRLAWAALLAATALLLAGCASTQPPPGVVPVAPFDVQRYAGRWYELARLDHPFERGLSDISAHYSVQPDGSVRVVNRGYASASGQWREAVGRALFTGAPTTGSLKVSFFGPFYGGYHVAALDADYRWALVVGPDTGYAWILAREPQLPAAQREAIVARARALGVDTQALIWVAHTRQDPAY
ncbi:outer membrane lipoprotein Blc [Melaminivora jejuensis]|uniref:lipocalin family protein n=1 Tax=Melaminivora jejuensis TaxID=1267217 RepID=UPI001AE00B0F|nr:lipocalin family protein [Melaminivora jejuensis]UHJ65713.1 lipocalin family protein [Melaminivora jejuensis]